MLRTYLVTVMIIAGVTGPSEIARADVGSLDPSFGAGGIQVTDLDQLDYAYDVLVRTDGSIVVVGRSEASGPATRDAVMVRYDADGAPIGTSIFSRTQWGCGDVPEAFHSVVEEADGRLLAAGYAQYDCGGPQRDFWIVRTLADGTEVERFDRPSFYDEIENGWEVAVRPDGWIVATGFAAPSASDPSTRDIAFTQYNPNGTVDTTGFGSGGETAVDVAGDYDFSYAMTLQPDGKIVAAGFATISGQRDLALVRLDDDGTLDTSFGTGGVATVDFNGHDDRARDVLALEDGRLLVAASRTAVDGVTREFVVARFSDDGTLDISFGTGGVAAVDFGAGNAAALALGLTPTGRIAVAGYVEPVPDDHSSRDFAVARLHPDGSLDTTFATDGRQVVGIVAGQEDVPLGMAVEPDGDLVLVGYTSEVVGGDDELTDIVLARLLGEGLLLFADGFGSGDLSGWSSTVP